MPYIRHIETLVPEPVYSQAEVCDLMLRRAGSEKAKRYIKKVYAESGIDSRHSVLSDFSAASSDPKLYRRADGTMKDASTGERNRVFVDEARQLIPEIARRAVANCKGVDAKDITHVITVSCTGFFNPGPDLLVIDALGLSPSVQRFQLGFMGCYAAIPALRMADQFCRADPSAVVLVLCIELCTIHMQDRDELDSVVANSVFADGLAVAIVSNQRPASGDRGLEISRFSSGIAREGVNDMAWDIGDHGFNIVLSKYVSRIIGAGIRGIIDEAFTAFGHSPSDIRTWAVHPGGRAILDKVESSLELRADQIEASRATLARYGNMSSATILFVLKEILGGPEVRDGDSICAMAFGPGLTIETSLLNAVVS